MIKDAVLRLLVEEEPISDGGLESLLAIIKYYKGNTSSIDLYSVIDYNYPLTSVDLLMNTAFECGLISVLCDDIDILTIINYRQPVIINTITTDNKSHYVVCYPYNDETGFSILCSRNGAYQASIEGLKSLRADKQCIAFCPN